MADRIAFRRRGDIMRDGIRVGWIERKGDIGPVFWRVRLTPASGSAGLLLDSHRTLRGAKEAATTALENIAK